MPFTLNLQRHFISFAIFFTVVSAERIFSSGSSYSDHRQMQNYEEIVCPAGTFNGIGEFSMLSYTYSMETAEDANIFDVIQNIEEQILLFFAENLLSCNDDEEEINWAFTNEQPMFTKEQLGIIGVKSVPEENTPSSLSLCVSVNNDCTIVHGALKLIIKEGVSVNFVRYASRYAIDQVMRSGYLATIVDNLISASYRAPVFHRPQNNTFAKIDTITEPPSHGMHGGSGGLSAMNKVILATLCSAVIGIVCAFVLFKKVFNSKQNCFAACDGTGMDKHYIEEAHFQSPHANSENGYENSFIAEDMEVVQYDIANGLSVINEDSDAFRTPENDVPLRAMSSLHRLNASDTNTVWTETGSIASEKTLPTSNRHRTPIFGNNDTSNADSDFLHVI